jgi:hypothetical protein
MYDGSGHGIDLPKAAESANSGPSSASAADLSEPANRTD